MVPRLDEVGEARRGSARTTMRFMVFGALPVGKCLRTKVLEPVTLKPTHDMIDI